MPYSIETKEYSSLSVNQKNKCNFSRDFISEISVNLPYPHSPWSEKYPERVNLSRQSHMRDKMCSMPEGRFQHIIETKEFGCKSRGETYQSWSWPWVDMSKGLNVWQWWWWPFPRGSGKQRPFPERKLKSKWWVTLSIPVVHVVAGEICFSPGPLWFLRNNFYH